MFQYIIINWRGFWHKLYSASCTFCNIYFSFGLYWKSFRIIAAQRLDAWRIYRRCCNWVYGNMDQIMSIFADGVKSMTGVRKGRCAILTKKNFQIVVKKNTNQHFFQTNDILKKSPKACTLDLRPGKSSWSAKLFPCIRTKFENFGHQLSFWLSKRFFRKIAKIIIQYIKTNF